MPLSGGASGLDFANFNKQSTDSNGNKDSGGGFADFSVLAKSSSSNAQSTSGGSAAVTTADNFADFSAIAKGIDVHTTWMRDFSTAALSVSAFSFSLCFEFNERVFFNGSQPNGWILTRPSHGSTQ